MHCVLLYHETAHELGKRDTAEAETYWGGWNAYMGAMAQAGVMIGGNGLQPPAAPGVNDEARRAAERAARLSRGRLVALLAARGGDIAAAEDAPQQHSL